VRQHDSHHRCDQGKIDYLPYLIKAIPSPTQNSHPTTSTIHLPTPLSLLIPTLIVILTPLTIAQGTATKFTAFIRSPSTPADVDQQSWVTFRLQPMPPSPVKVNCTAITLAHTDILSNHNYWPCDPYTATHDQYFGFTTPEGFNEITVIKTWRDIYDTG
jgi:hypothetical protein